MPPALVREHGNGHHGGVEYDHSVREGLEGPVPWSLAVDGVVGVEEEQLSVVPVVELVAVENLENADADQGMQLAPDDRDLLERGHEAIAGVPLAVPQHDPAPAADVEGGLPVVHEVAGGQGRAGDARLPRHRGAHLPDPLGGDA